MTDAVSPLRRYHWIASQFYRLAHEGRRFQHNQNLLILPQ